MTSIKITVHALVSANKNKVWDYYTLPEHITKWNFADPSWHCPSAANDMCLGGTYRARMEAKDGSFGFNLEAIYSALVMGESFTYDLADGRKASVDFSERDGKTEVKIIFDAETENPVEMQRIGWQAILDNFKNYTENN